MNNYFIALDQESTSLLDAHRISTLISTYDNSVLIRWIQDPTRYYLLEWEIPTAEGDRLVGMLSNSKRSIALEGTLEDCVAFAIWFQQQYPQRRDLLFFNDQGSFGFYLHGLSIGQVIEKVEGEEFSISSIG